MPSNLLSKLSQNLSKKDLVKDFLASPKKFFSKDKNLADLTKRELINLESQIGAEIFGRLSAKKDRKFFNLDSKTWIWHESWTDGSTKDGLPLTVRYEILEDGVLKTQGDARYSYIKGQELRNFILAVEIYYERVMREVYRRDPRTGKRL